MLLTGALGSLPLFSQTAAALDIVVTNTNDSGGGSLRAAITAIDASVDPVNRISFGNVHGAINLLSNLPAVTKPVTIDFNVTGFGIGFVTGNFGLSVASAGVVTLNNIHSYQGDTVVTSGTLSIGTQIGGAAPGQFAAPNSLLVMNAGSTLNLPANSFGVEFQNLSGAGTIVNNAQGNGILLLGGSTVSRTFAGTISGTGNLSMYGGGEKLTLTGSTTYSGLTFLAGSVDLTGGHNFNLELAAGATNVLSPNSGFDVIGAATLRLNDFNQTIGSLDDPSTAFGNQLAKVVLGSAILTTGGNNASTEFAGVISGTGGIVKTGTGTMTLSGTNTYTGTTSIDAGTLSVNGSIAASSLTRVNGGGTLGGSGVVGNTSVNGGTLAPGNSIGQLTVQGSLAFTAASSYMIEVSPANADRVNVTGAATLGGASVKASFAAGTYVARQYTILNATGGINGVFGTQTNTSLPPNFRSTLSYDANNVYLNLALDFLPPPSTGLGGNQQNVANAIVGFFNSNGGIPLVFGGLSPAGLTQVSGEIATGSQQATFNAMTQFMGVLMDPFIGGRSEVGAPSFASGTGVSSFAASTPWSNGREREAYAAVYNKAPPRNPGFDGRWNVWAAGFGGSQTTDANMASGFSNTTSSLAGMAVGADYLMSPTTIAGFALAGGATSFNVAGGGSGRSDLFQAGAFIRHTVGAAYLSGALAYGWQDVTTDRSVTIAGVDRLRAQFDANAFSGRVEGGYRFVSPWMGIGLSPYAAGQFTVFELPGYAEQALSGSNTFALSYGAKDVTAARSELGVRSDKSFAVQDAVVTLRGRLAWAHDYNSARSATAAFQTLPGASFVVNGAPAASDAALTTASAEMKWRNGFALAATFEGEFSGVSRSFAGKGVARYGW